MNSSISNLGSVRQFASKLDEYLTNALLEVLDRPLSPSDNILVQESPVGNFMLLKIDDRYSQFFALVFNNGDVSLPSDCGFHGPVLFDHQLNRFIEV